MGGQIVSGTGQIGSANAQALTVTQSSPKMIVDWASFNVGAGSTVTFVQPGSSSVALNRVTGPDTSTIQGSIRANGQVFLVNPNGVYFAPGSQISVGALVASTLKISNEDFNSGRYRFEGNSTAQLINEGSITATGDGTNSGAAYFIAARVINRGSIDAPHGKVGLASGRKVMLDIGAPVPLQIDESAIDGLIEQSGIIKADGGQIMITSKAASALHASVINQTGTLQATSLGIGQNGEIILSAGENGTANISGTLNVSSPDNQAGRVEVTAQKITIKDGARIDATGQTGGGTVLIGGDWQGSGATQQAKTVSVEPDVEIDASAKSLGDGGKVVVWSDIRDPGSITSVSGSLKSEGGSIQGNGGMIETSGHALQVDGIRISTQAPNGKTGLWLLDPYNIEIGSGGTTGTTGTYTATADNSVVNVGALQSALATSNVTVSTGSSGSQDGDITVSSPISFASGRLLTLDAARNVVLNNTLTLTGGSDLSIIAGGGLSGASGVSLASGSTLTVNQSGSSTYSGVISGAGSVTKSGAGTLTLTGSSTFTGGLTIDSGNLVATGGQRSLSRVSTNAVTIRNSGTLTLASDDVFGIHSDTDTLNPIEVQAGGTLTNLGTNKFNRLGPLTLSGGTVTSASGFTGSSYTNGAWLFTGTLNVTENSTISGIGGIFSGYNGAGLTINVSSGKSLNVAPPIFDGVATGFGFLATNSSLTKSGAGTLTLSGSNTYTGATTVSAGTLSIGSGGTTGSVTSASIVNSSVVEFNRSNDLTYSGVISGTGALTKLGGGTLTLTGTNTYSGVTTISNGTLAIGSGGSSGSITSASIVDNAALQFNRSDALTYSGTISGTGTVTKIGSGTLTLSGTNTYSGGSTVGLGTLEFTQRTGLGSGTVTLNNSSTNGDVTLSSLYSVLTNSVPTDSNYFISNSITVAPRTSGASGTTTIRTTDAAGGPKTAFGGTLTLNAPLTIIAGNTDRTSWYGQITGDGNLTVTGSISGGCPAGGNQCRFTLNRDTSLPALANDFTGTLSLVGTGTKLQFTPLPGVTTNTVPTGISLNLGAGTQVYNYLNFQARALTGSGTLNGLDTSTVTVENLTDSTFSGSIINSSGTLSLIKSGIGTLTLSGNNTYNGASTITAGTLSIGNGGTTGSIASTTINNNGLITFNRVDDLTYSGVISGTGNLSKLGAGALYLDGTNTYSGASTISEGTLSIGNGGPTGSINSATINNSGALVFNRAGDSTFGGTISGTGTLTKLGNGTLYLTGENDYSGLSTITAGTLSVGNSGTTGSISGSSINNASAVHFNRSSSSTYSGVISGTGTLTKLGVGTLYLTGTSTYSGTTTITAGTLSIGDGGASGSISNSTISNSSALHFNRSDDFTYSGIISGTGSLSKLGAGSLTLSGANTFDGLATISEGTLVAAHNTALGSATGNTTVQSGATLQISSGTTISAENLTVNGSGVSASSGALVLSATGNYSSGTITVASDSKLLINGLVTDPEVILGAMSGPANTLNINLASGRQVSQSAPANLNKLAFTGSAGIANFLNTGNTVNTIAAEIGSLSFVNSTDLTVGTVNPSGITATGIVSLSTVSGDLHVNAPITTSNLGSSNTPITLNAGTSSAAGTSTGGDIKIASGVTITSTGGGRTTLYTGGVTGSTGINNVVSYGSGNFRYNASQASLPADVASSATGYYAIYREQPTIAVQADDKSKIFDNIPFSASLLTFTCTGCANGDSPLITYTGTAARGNALYIGAYPITATYDATYLTNVGYRVVGTDVTPGTLNIVPFPGYIPPARETVERASQIPIRYLIENMQPTKLKTVLADHPTLVSLFSTSLTKGEIKLAYQDGTAYRENVRLRERVVQDTIFFDAGKSNLTNEATRTLDSLLRTANRYSLNSVEVVGHTELPSNSEDALKLSEARASVVSDYLQNRLSRERRPEKIASLGRSYLQPISDNITYSGRARNRRAEITITGAFLD